MLNFLALALFQSPPVQYRISFPDPEQHLANIQVEFPAVPGTLEVRMSRSSPGRYAAHDFAKNVFNVVAYDDKAAVLPITRPNAHQWNIDANGKAVKLSYTIFGNHVDGTYLGIDSSHAHMNMPATFMWARGLEGKSIGIKFDIPKGLKWKVATQLYPTADPLTFTAPNLPYFMDSPTELSDFELRSFNVNNTDGKTFEIRAAVHHDGPPSAMDEYIEGTKKIVLEERAIFGEFPDFETGRYTFIGDYVPWGGGDGMEHRNSTVVAGPVSFKSPGVAAQMLGTVSHEFFHCWNVERIRPKSLEPFNLEDANMSGELWLAEGFTQYYGILTLGRTGLEPQVSVMKQLASTAARVASQHGPKLRSAVEMSMLAPFVDAATSIDPTNFEYSFVSYYSFGAAIALAMDLELRTRSNGKVSLDDYMRAMWRVHGKPAGEPGTVTHPYTIQDACDRLVEASGDRKFAEDFFARYVIGRQMPDFKGLLSNAGVLLKASTQPWSGMSVVAGKVSNLPSPDSPGFKAGLSQGDTILRIDGKPFISLEESIKGKRAGETVQVEVRRNTGAVVNAAIILGSDPMPEILTYEEAGLPVSSAIRAFRASWLNSKVR